MFVNSELVNQLLIVDLIIRELGLMLDVCKVINEEELNKSVKERPLSLLLALRLAR